MWTGFRAPLQKLRQFSLLLSLLVLVCVFSVTGWVLSRWRSEDLARALSSERLRVRALEQELKNPLAMQHSSPTKISQNSFLPSLSGEEIKSSLIEIQNFDLSLSVDKKEFSVNFEFSRDKTLENSASYYWLIALHSPKGILIFPQAFSSQRGEVLQYKKGELLENVQGGKTVSAKFSIGEFVKEIGSQEVYASLYVYNDLGSLLVSRRKELNVQ